MSQIKENSIGRQAAAKDNQPREQSWLSEAFYPHSYHKVLLVILFLTVLRLWIFPL